MIFIYAIPVIIVLAAVFLLFSKGVITMKTRSTVINESKYLKARRTDPGTSSSIPKDTLIHPFSLEIEPMDKLVLFDIEDDPLYETLELQEFDDETSKGLVILMYRKDKEIDVYYTRGIAHDVYKGSQNGSVSEILPKEYYFEKTDDNFRFLINFRDKDGNDVFVKADEKNPDKEHISILAPAGDMIDNFTSFPLFFMKETAFLEKDHARITIRIGQQERKPVSIPIAINGKFVYLSRYSLDPVVASFNENFKGNLKPAGSVEDPHLRYTVSGDSPAGDLLALDYCKLNHQVSLKFSPPFPNLRSLKDGARIKGRFSTTVDSESGILAGSYAIERGNGKVSVSLQPQKGWQPMPGKKWFTKYKWVSTVSFDGDQVYAESEWVKQ